MKVNVKTGMAVFAAGTAPLTLEKPIINRQRTPQSLAFEAAWRDTRRGALVPERKNLQLRPFKHMLADMLLIEFFPEEHARSCIKIVGNQIRERVQRDIVGQDHFAFIPQSHRGDTADILRTVVNQPCGLWQIMAAHYERGYAHCYEVTIFPLLHEGHAPQLMAMIVPCPGQIFQVPRDIAVISLEGPRDSAFLDIGAGLPPP